MKKIVFAAIASSALALAACEQADPLPQPDPNATPRCTALQEEDGECVRDRAPRPGTDEKEQ